MSYQDSRLYALAKIIKETGLTARELSIDIGKNKYYLTTETKESRFNRYGDITESKFTNLKFAVIVAAANKKAVENVTQCKPKKQESNIAIIVVLIAVLFIVFVSLLMRI